ncbi:MAG TPA: hypothetical protein PLB01_00150 [Thermoanaerobaculia bacterium]|nr:hypothetical protein [Thermoanaerobaculia bacterium]
MMRICQGPRCGRQFPPNPGERGTKRRYCSRACYVRAKLWRQQGRTWKVAAGDVTREILDSLGHDDREPGEGPDYTFPDFTTFDEAMA